MEVHFLVVFSAMFYCFSCLSQKAISVDLEESFRNPPVSAKPQTWMHALDGNMSDEGLTKDLETTANVGIAGILLFNISYRIPSGTIKYNSPEHIALLKHAAEELKIVL